MVDAICGPSNALQTFQKQTSVDRTLQQDRIAARQAQAESFRSAPGPNAGVLDAEFEAFQAGHPFPGPHPEPQYHHSPPHALGQDARQTRAPSWATDFQNLHLNESRSLPLSSSQFNQNAPLQLSTPSAWHQDFMRQQGQPSASQTIGQQKYLTASSRADQARWGNIAEEELQRDIMRQQQYPTGDFAYGYTGGSQLPKFFEPSSTIPADRSSSQEAFEKVFEAYSSEARQPESYDARVEQAHQDQDEIHKTDNQQSWLPPEQFILENQERIGSDRILDQAEESQTEEREEDEADELARTAGQLLQNVSGDQSQKFQESNFLSLMRQLRDKEVRVEGDKIVDVTQPLHPGGEYYPRDAQALRS